MQEEYEDAATLRARLQAAAVQVPAPGMDAPHATDGTHAEPQVLHMLFCPGQ